MKELSARLEAAIQHLADAEAIIQRQRERVAQHMTQGSLTPALENMLAGYIENLNSLHDQAERLRGELDSLRK